jgi:hypothetical protein
MIWGDLVADQKLYRFTEKWATKSEVAPTCSPWKDLALRIGAEAQKSLDSYKSAFEADQTGSTSETNYDELYRQSSKQLKQLHQTLSILDDPDTLRDLVFCIATLMSGISIRETNRG